MKCFTSDFDIPCSTFDIRAARHCERECLRRMLSKRHRPNRLRQSRTVGWPNDCFRGHGFRSLRDAHSRFVQSLAGNLLTDEPYAGKPHVRF